MAYEVLLHLVYLLKSIDLFKAIEIYYTLWVQMNLIVFMANIRDILRKSWHYLHDLMNKLIKKFCDVINRIFKIIEAKLLFYLCAMYASIVVDYTFLAKDVEEFKSMLLELQSDLGKYLSISQSVNQLLKALKILKKDNNFIKEIIKDNNKVRSIFSYQNDKISHVSQVLSTIELERSIKSKGDKNEIVMNLKISLGNLKENLSAIINLNRDNTLIVKVTDRMQGKIKASIRNFNGSQVKGVKNGVDPINKLLDEADKEVSKEILSIIQQLNVLEIINLLKLYHLTTRIQIKYLDILFRCHLINCTIEFYNEVTRNVSEMFGSLDFESSKVSEFLTKTSDLEDKIKSVSSSINKCITNLAKSLNCCKGCIFRKQPIDSFIKLIQVISILKFYVDLMVMEIIIFKSIIFTLIEMSVISFTLDGVMLYIFTTTDIDIAIKTLIDSYWYLKAFYFIQLQNTTTIVGLSSKLNFSKYINQYYGVLVFNLDLINRLIWAIECYFNHLLVFRYVSIGLNSQVIIVGSLGDIIVQISNVGKSISTITNKLKSIHKSIKQLNEIQSRMDITNWKQSSQSIRDQTESVSRQIREINSEIDLITGYLRSIYESFGKLLGIYYFLSVLISYVYNEIKNNNKYRILETGIGNEYYTGVIQSVMEPCNKQLKFILGYLLVMWLYIGNLIKIVEGTIVVIYAKMGLLSGLTSKLQTDILNINKGVVDMECAIEGVARNFIKCSTKQLSINIGGLDINKTVVGVYSVLNVMDYKVVVNRMLEFWTFSDQYVELFKYIRFCLCALSFETKHKSDRPSRFPYRMHSIKISDVNPVSEFGRKTMSENLGNHMCLCLVIKYHMRPTLLKCILYLRNEELGTLDTLSRKYERYNKLTCVNLVWKLCGLVLNIIYELTSLLRNRYTDVMTRKNDSLLYELYKLFTFLANVAHDITYPLHQGIIANLSRCFCMYSNDPDYHYIISITLYVSSLIENIWTMDTETLRMAIQKLSLLYSQLEIYDVNSNSLKPVCCNPVYSLIVHKECEPKKKEKCCCCWCTSVVNVLVMCISLSIQCKLCNALCNKKEKTNLCEKVDKFFEIDKFDCKCAQPKKGVCCLLKTLCSQAQSTNAGGCEELQEALKKCSETCGVNGCCKKLAAKLSSGLCKLLLLGSECNCTEPPADGQLKVKCVFFNNPWGCTSVAVVVYCKCSKPGEKCCCLTTVIENFKSKLQTKLEKICNGDDCVCKELENVCDHICGQECGPECREGCPCKELKKSLEEFKKICGENSGKCLCKQIKEVIDMSCIKKEKCDCKNKGCCKVLGASVKILARACRSNVLEPYNRITIELLRYGNNKGELNKSILERINDSMVKKISLIKISCSSYPDSKIGLKDISSVRNWGYDTQYGHHVTTYNDVNKCDTTGDSNRGTRNKMFKLVLSRLLIALFIKVIFIFIRISYQQTIVIDSSLDNTDSENKFPKSPILSLKNIFTVI